MPLPGADPGNSERGGRASFGKKPYTGMWKIYEIFWEYFFKSNSLPVNILKIFIYMDNNEKSYDFIDKSEFY
jgi:hypothetical protein